jgi:hypothetical protein
VCLRLSERLHDLPAPLTPPPHPRVHAGMRSAASTGIASSLNSLVHQSRVATVFLCNSFVALALASAVQLLGTVLAVGAAGYLAVAAAAEAAAAAAALNVWVRACYCPRISVVVDGRSTDVLLAPYRLLNSSAFPHCPFTAVAPWHGYTCARSIRRPAFGNASNLRLFWG